MMKRIFSDFPTISHSLTLTLTFDKPVMDQIRRLTALISSSSPPSQAVLHQELSRIDAYARLGLPSDSHSLLPEFGTLIRLPHAHVLVPDGGLVPHLFIVVAGTIVRKPKSAKTAQVERVYTTADVVGLHSLLFGQPVVGNVVAVNDCILFVLEDDLFDQTVRSDLEAAERRKRRIIDAMRPFSLWPEPQRELFSCHCYFVSSPRGSILCKEGTAPEGLHIIARGTAKCFKAVPLKARSTSARTLTSVVGTNICTEGQVLRCGDAIDPDGVFAGKAHSETVMALEAMESLFVPLPDLFDMLGLSARASYRRHKSFNNTTNRSSVALIDYEEKEARVG